MQVLQDGSEVKLQVGWRVGGGLWAFTAEEAAVACCVLGVSDFCCVGMQRNALSVLEMGPPESLDDISGSSSDTEAREPKIGAFWLVECHIGWI